MGDDGGRPRRNLAPVRYQFEPRLEVKQEHEMWPVRAHTPLGATRRRGEAARDMTRLPPARGCCICGLGARFAACARFEGPKR